jgi:hypothetical protein
LSAIVTASLETRYKDSGTNDASTKVPCLCSSDARRYCTLIVCPARSKSNKRPSTSKSISKKHNAREYAHPCLVGSVALVFGNTTAEISRTVAQSHLSTLKPTTAWNNLNIILETIVTCRRQAQDTHRVTCLTSNPKSMSPTRFERRSAGGALSKASGILSTWIGP